MTTLISVPVMVTGHAYGATERAFNAGRPLRGLGLEITVSADSYTEWTFPLPEGAQVPPLGAVLRLNITTDLSDTTKETQ